MEYRRAIPVLVASISSLDTLSVKSALGSWLVVRNLALLSNVTAMTADDWGCFGSKKLLQRRRVDRTDPSSRAAGLTT